MKNQADLTERIIGAVFEVSRGEDSPAGQHGGAHREP